MDDQLSADGAEHGGFPWIWLPLLFAFYVLSTGPAVKLAVATHASGRYFVVYAPLGAAAQAYEPLDRFFKWYVYKVWEIPGPGPTAQQ